MQLMTSKRFRVAAQKLPNAPGNPVYPSFSSPRFERFFGVGKKRTQLFLFHRLAADAKLVAISSDCFILRVKTKNLIPLIVLTLLFLVYCQPISFRQRQHGYAFTKNICNFFTIKTFAFIIYVILYTPLVKYKRFFLERIPFIGCRHFLLDLLG